MSNLRYQCVGALLVVAVLGPSVSPGQAIETSKAIVFKKCYSAQASAIFGGDASACLAYSFTKQQATYDVEICGGLYIGGGAKLGGIGVDVGTQGKLCMVLNATVSASSPAEAMGKLKDKGPGGKALRETLLRDLKKQLRDLPDSALKDLQLDRKKIEGLREFEFENLRDDRDRAPKIREGLEQCPGIVKPLS